MAGQNDLIMKAGNMSCKDIKIDLGPVQETLMMPLWDRARETEKNNPIVFDAYAKNIVESTYAEQTAAETYKGCEAYLEYEKLCARDDIDSVFICTPDHWHAMCSLAAIKTGKDVYCQKPMTLTIPGFIYL